MYELDSCYYKTLWILPGVCSRGILGIRLKKLTQWQARLDEESLLKNIR